MKSHFALVTQISANQTFVHQNSTQSILSSLEEIHKKKRKKRIFLYLNILKKQKKSFDIISKFSLFNINEQSSVKKKAFSSVDLHFSLFKKQKNADKKCLGFGFSQNFKAFQIIKHCGYSIYGEDIWHYTK